VEIVEEERTWSDLVQAATVDAALLEVFCRLRAEIDLDRRIRFVVDLPRGYTLWRYADELSASLPRCSAKRPGVDDVELISLARKGLPAEFEWGPPPLDPLIAATDGSARRGTVGYGWLAEDGQFGLDGAPYAKHWLGPERALIAELLAIDDAVRVLTNRQLTLLCDSSSAIRMIRGWMKGEETLPVGYFKAADRPFGPLGGLVEARERLHVNRDRVMLRRVIGHRHEPLNEGADALARLASRYAIGNSGLSPDEYRDRASGIAAGCAAAFRQDRQNK